MADTLEPAARETGVAKSTNLAIDPARAHKQPGNGDVTGRNRRIAPCIVDRPGCVARRTR
jgi:hypothetical protein